MGGCMERRIVVDVLHVPEAMFVLRSLLADRLRAEARYEANPQMAHRLRELAAEFEAAIPVKDAHEVRNNGESDGA